MGAVQYEYEQAKQRGGRRERCTPRPNEDLTGRDNRHSKRGQLAGSQQTIRDPKDGGNRHITKSRGVKATNSQAMGHLRLEGWVQYDPWTPLATDIADPSRGVLHNKHDNESLPFASRLHAKID